MDGVLRGVSVVCGRVVTWHGVLSSTAEEGSPSTGWGITSRTDSPTCCAPTCESERGTTLSLLSNRLFSVSISLAGSVFWVLE